jgi:steroid 5-alpha reductase family enzyme
MYAAIGLAFAQCALFILAYVTAWYVLALAMRRNDVADVAWGLGPTLLAWWLAAREGFPAHLVLIAVLVSVWGVRLAYHIARRGFGPGRSEDPRYAKWRAEWKYVALRSYLQVFLLQGFFMLLVSSPIVVLSTSAVGSPGGVVIAGVVVWLVGLAFEQVADAQLAGFLARPAKERPRVMDRGLWGWSRHPNYFGESLMWWGLAIIACGVPAGWIAFLGPITITWLLVFVSGIPLLEARHVGEPEWEAYKRRTSAFIPMPPKSAPRDED